MTHFALKSEFDNLNEYFRKCQLFYSNFLKFENIFGMNVMRNRSDFWLQFPIKLSHHHDKTAADHLGLNYVTERILASVLPNLSHQQQQHRQQQQQLKQARDNGFNNDGPHIVEPVLDESPQDIYEQELISMLEQKHGKVNTDFFFLPLSRCQTLCINIFLLTANAINHSLCKNWITLFSRDENQIAIKSFSTYSFVRSIFNLIDWIDFLLLLFIAPPIQNYKLFDLESCISTITLEKLCELCKHMDSWLGSGRERVVILQDR